MKKNSHWVCNECPKILILANFEFLEIKAITIKTQFLDRYVVFLGISFTKCMVNLRIGDDCFTLLQSKQFKASH